ncbi:hypothetical protein VTJ83DRAFT_6561 [Remersonia thermophila]|uniref:Uncharacterized protein n=1 Tax=Remersonia thermophila TaxID=72144 RepID=A0ABR4D6K1_9PEZI
MFGFGFGFFYGSSSSSSSSCSSSSLDSCSTAATPYGTISSPMDIALRSSSSRRGPDPECAYPSWPRRLSLGEDDSEERATSYIPDDELFPDVFEDDASSVSSASPVHSPVAAPALTEAEIVQLHREQLAYQREMRRILLAEKELRRRAAEQDHQRRRQGGAKRRTASGPSKRAKGKLPAMATIAEAEPGRTEPAWILLAFPVRYRHRAYLDALELPCHPSCHRRHLSDLFVTVDEQRQVASRTHALPGKTTEEEELSLPMTTGIGLTGKIDIEITEAKFSATLGTSRKPAFSVVPGPKPTFFGCWGGKLLPPPPPHRWKSQQKKTLGPSTAAKLWGTRNSQCSRCQRAEILPRIYHPTDTDPSQWETPIG